MGHGRGNRKTGKWSTARGRNPHPALTGPDDDGSEYSKDEIEFMFACYRRMRILKTVSLTPREIIAVARSLGYRNYKLNGLNGLNGSNGLNGCSK